MKSGDVKWIPGLGELGNVVRPISLDGGCCCVAKLCILKYIKPLTAGSTHQTAI